MQINIAESSGFCFGVTRAVNICLELLKKDKRVYLLRDIVHNRQVMNSLEKKGIKKLEHLSDIGGGKLVISAHGAGKKTFREAVKCNFEIIDATCPKVKEIYDIAEKLEQDRTLVIIGDKEHDEIKGIAGQLRKEPIIISTEQEVKNKINPDSGPLGVITQSTQTSENIEKILKKIRSRADNVKFVDTTCRITRVKQQEVQRMPLENDIVLIIGSYTSANTRRLYEISKSINERTYWLEGPDDLTEGMLKNTEKIGLMAGASTPEKLTREIIDMIGKINKIKTP